MGKASRVFLGITLALVLIAGAGVSVVVALTNAPDFGGMKSKVDVPIKLADGTKSKKWMGPAAPGWVPIKEISNDLLMAVIASEDTTFFSHNGVDYHELREAMKKDLNEKKWARGASTLTEQVVKNVYLSPEKSVWRKIREFLWAQQLEKNLTKSQILCFYVNMAEWGPGIYGIGEASRHYFQESPSEISPKQGAFLAMLLPSPIKYHIYYQRRELTDWSTKRVNQILHVMNAMGFIDDTAYEQARMESLWGEQPKLVDPSAVPSDDEDKSLGFEAPAITLMPPQKNRPSETVPQSPTVEDDNAKTTETLDENQKSDGTNSRSNNAAPEPDSD